MFSIATDVDASDVLRAFRHDGPYLFAGAAFATAGLLAAGFAALERKRDTLLVNFALFAVSSGFALKYVMQASTGKPS